MAQISLFDETPDTPTEDKREKPAAAPDHIMRVLVPYPFNKAYDYAVPNDMKLRAGDYVSVPLSGRNVIGVVWDEAEGTVNPKKLKSIVWHYNDMPPMPEIHRQFIDWVAKYTMSAKGAVLKMSLSAGGNALEPPKAITAYKAKKPLDVKGLSPKRKAIVEVLSDGLARRPSEIAELAGCSAGIPKAMADQGLLERVEIFSAAPCRNPDLERTGPSLSESQDVAAEALCNHVCSGEYHVSLLDGVTGAGKTETYFEAVAESLKADKQVLILLPEIALSNAFLERFKARFGCAPALWHSHLTPAQRRKTWSGVTKGETKVVVGARSALFLPYADLGFIVVDEEHDPAYKQEDGVIYNARDMAIVRALKGQIPITLVSATPSIETMFSAWNGKYEHLILSDRYGGARMPNIQAIDLKEHKPESQHFISPVLKNAIIETIRKDEQALLFLNRRGYAPLTICRSCGHRMECPRCTAWLVEHRASNRLNCHHCGFFQKIPQECPECGDHDTLTACGPGVERIFEEAKEYFPDANIMVLASDTADDHDSFKVMLEKIQNGEIDIIIGTQIIAKGHHFPNLTCVGVIDADLGLQGGELRAAERTYQLLHQVAGRAGREEKPGHVFLQSYMPEHKIMHALSEGNRDGFLDTELQEREMAHMPPFARLAGIIVAGRDEQQVIELSKQLGKTAPQGETIQTLGPAPAPMARLRGKYRYRLLVRSKKNVDIQKAIKIWLKPHKIPSNTRVYVDIDPQSFM
ncbi:MAG: primosomal protein N' [Pseudomonadota bacterium]